MRAEFQVLIIGYIKSKFLILKRSDMDIWQFVSGGGEGKESFKETAIREFKEEVGIKVKSIFKLDSISSIPSNIFKEHRDKKDLYVLPEYCYAIKLNDENIVLSDEHKEYIFADYDEAMKLLHYDSNKVALYELNRRIKENNLKEV